MANARGVPRSAMAVNLLVMAALLAIRLATPGWWWYPWLAGAIAGVYGMRQSRRRGESASVTVLYGAGGAVFGLLIFWFGRLQ